MRSKEKFFLSLRENFKLSFPFVCQISCPINDKRVEWRKRLYFLPIVKKHVLNYVILKLGEFILKLKINIYT